jgi:hypothetical protein
MSLKKIVKEPESSAPELMRQIASLAHEELQPEDRPVVIPTAVLYNSNLKQMKGFRALRSNMKRDLFLKEFISQGKEALEPYILNEETMYDVEIVKFIMQTAEDVFIHYSKQGDEKRRAVIEVCKKYFDDNEILVSKTIEQMLPFINHSNFWRRNRSRLYNIALLFLGLFKGK